MERSLDFHLGVEGRFIWTDFSMQELIKQMKFVGNNSACEKVEPKI